MINIKRFIRYSIFLTVFIFIGSINCTQILASNKINRKTVYLTFQGGPSINLTNNIINTLSINDIKATFFVVGDCAKIYPYIIKDLNEKKMCIMPNCNVRDYKNIYKSEKRYFKDLNKCKDNIKSIIGESKLNFIRLPGGANSSFCKPNILKGLKDKIISDGENYIDWTISLGSENLKEIDSEFIKSKIREEGGLYNVEVVNMNDFAGNNATSESLQWVIDFYKERKYKFKTLHEIEEWEMEYLKNINVINKIN